MAKSYWQVHRDLMNQRGRAVEHLCSCGRQAKDWAFKGDLETALTSTRGTGIGCKYSEDIWNDYEPRCRSCHHLEDMTDEKRERSRRNVPNSLAKVWSRPGPRGSGITNAMQRVCLDCGLVTTPGPMAKHLKYSDHSGWENLTDASVC